MKARLMLSGYRSALYDQWLRGWRRVQIEVTDSASSAKEKPIKLEQLYMNYDEAGNVLPASRRY